MAIRPSKPSRQASRLLTDDYLALCRTAEGLAAMPLPVPVPVGTYLDSTASSPGHGRAALPLPGPPGSSRGAAALCAVGGLLTATIRKPHRASRTSQRPNRRQ